MTKTSWIFALLLLLGAVNIITSYPRMSYTADEPARIEAGMQLLKTGTLPQYNIHPPLAGVVVALPLYMLDKISDNRTLDYMSPREAYLTKIWLTRIGVLPFYLLSCTIIFIWSRELFGHRAALWSVFSYVTLSAVTAHAGLATTDMIYTALFLWALKAGTDWLRHPTNHASLILGLSLGLMVSAKMSGVVHWPAAMMLIMAAQTAANWRYATFLLPVAERHLIRGLFYVFPVGLFVVGLFYHFDYTPFGQTFTAVKNLNASGLAFWMFGPLHNQPLWYFFPVVFFFKTPLPFLVASVIGIWVIVDHARRPSVQRLFPLLAAYAIVLVSMTSGFNLGVRHALPLYPLLAIPAGFAIYLLEKAGGWKRTVGLALMGWQLVGFVIQHPHHLSYFNELAGAHPEIISPGSDFDWGQEMIELDEALQERNIDTIYACVRRVPSMRENLRYLLHAQTLPCPGHPVSGWIAVSRTERLVYNEHFTWLDGIEAVEPIGTTLDLYYIP